MFKINDYVVYRRDVCKILDLTNSNNTNYYVLAPVDDISLKITVPINTNIRKLISKKDAEELIDIMPTIEVIELNDKMLENEYKKLYHSDNHEDLIKIIKTTYQRNKDRTNNNKKISDKDDYYFKLAEKKLLNELSICLDLNYNDTKNYIIKKIKTVI